MHDVELDLEYACGILMVGKTLETLKRRLNDNGELSLGTCRIPTELIGI